MTTEWKPEHISDVAVLLSKCEDVYSADVPSSLQVKKYINVILALHPRAYSAGSQYGAQSVTVAGR